MEILLKIVISLLVWHANECFSSIFRDQPYKIHPFEEFSGTRPPFFKYIHVTVMVILLAGSYPKLTCQSICQINTENSIIEIKWDGDKEKYQKRRIIRSYYFSVFEWQYCIGI